MTLKLNSNPLKRLNVQFPNAIMLESMNLLTCLKLQCTTSTTRDNGSKEPVDLPWNQIHNKHHKKRQQKTTMAMFPQQPLVLSALSTN